MVAPQRGAGGGGAAKARFCAIPVSNLSHQAYQPSGLLQYLPPVAPAGSRLQDDGPVVVADISVPWASTRRALGRRTQKPELTPELDYVSVVPVGVEARQRDGEARWPASN